MFILLSVLIVLILIVLYVFGAFRSGKPLPFLDREGKPIPGSISEKIHVDINGIQQGMFIMGKDTGNPVLLYLHGGLPDFFLTEKYPTGLEDHFTVAWWEQRGSGLSYSADIPSESMTLEQMIADTKEVTHYLRKRFGKEKIYLMGHSGGTFIGIRVAAESPELYHAYIGIAQMSHQLKSEMLAHEYMLQQFRKNGNENMARKLEAAPVTMADGTTGAYLSLRDKAMHSLGIGTMRQMHSVVKDIFFASLRSRSYTFQEKINLWRGKASSGVSSLWNEMLSTDLINQLNTFEIPVYFFHGIYDYTVSYPLAKEYYTNLTAPVKGFYTFEESAHSPLFEEPAKMIHILQHDVLNGKNELADNR